MFPTCLHHEKPLLDHLIRLMIRRKKSHYEVLNLSRNCTEKEIKDAFIKLSKELHPDRNKSSNTHEAFVRVTEAYSVLSKPQSRAQYDVTPIYTNKGSTHQKDYAGDYGRKTGARTFYTDFNDYTNSTQAREQLRRSHTSIVMICLGVACVGFMLQLWVIMTSAHKRQVKQDAVSKSSAEHLAKVRAAAAVNGNERMGALGALDMLVACGRLTDGQLQTQLMLQRVAKGATPTASTAALADTLIHK